MNQDLLERAVTAVRDGTNGDVLDPGVSERLILERAGRRGGRQRRMPFYVVPLLAALVASAAFATSNGRLSSFVSMLTRAQHTPATGTKAPPPGARDRIAASPPAPGEHGEAAPPYSLAERTRSADPVVGSPESTARSPARGRTAFTTKLRLAPNPTVTPPDVSATFPATPAPDVSAVSREDALYRAAHRAQFFEHDYASAVTDWDVYLNAAPTGSFALEARFNRAVALARLGRTTEARSALVPFARGDYGLYRQSDAQALLDALGR